MMRKILVVDDDAASLRAICRVFADDDDLHLQGAEDGEKALLAVRAWAPDLVLLDILMPGIDGYEVCRRIKGDPASSTTMVLLLSGRSAVEDRLQGYAVQADDYIAKPYDPHELQAKVAILLRLKMAQDQLRAMNRDLELVVKHRTEELLRKERQAIMGEMIQGIVHNLKGPLSGSLGFASLAREEIKEYLVQARGETASLAPRLTTLAGYIDLIVQSNEKLRALIDSLLVKSRKDAAMERTELALNEIINTELQFLNADMRIKHQIDKELILAGNIPAIRGVYVDFSQLFCNLIRNAADAMAETPVKKLTIRSAWAGEEITVAVQDTGCGMEPAVMAKIFDPFFSTKAVSHPAAGGGPQGSGLGLYTCAGIIKAYGGRITVSSQPGQGSCFTVHIPRTALPGLSA